MAVERNRDRLQQPDFGDAGGEGLDVAEIAAVALAGDDAVDGERCGSEACFGAAGSHGAVSPVAHLPELRHKRSARNAQRSPSGLAWRSGRVSNPSGSAYGSCGLRPAAPRARSKQKTPPLTRAAFSYVAVVEEVVGSAAAAARSRSRLRLRLSAVSASCSRRQSASASGLMIMRPPISISRGPRFCLFKP